MRFIINEIVLWLKDGRLRKLSFEANKVNIITGDSGTGKSTILDIIDYCFFASRIRIPEEIINENINWYGIKFIINDKQYTIARGSLDYRGQVSKKYYFSGDGEVPIIPEQNIDESALKSIIEKEFSIDHNVVIPYGGKSLKAGTKISLRYFLLFNTQSGDVITHSKVFFDKQDDEKYREALQRIFDLAADIDNVNNILAREKAVQIEKEVARLERKRFAYEKESKVFESEVANLVRQAKQYDLIDDTHSNIQEGVNKLKVIVNEDWSPKVVVDFSELYRLNEVKRTLLRKIRNLKRFKYEYQTYKQVLTQSHNSLKPIEYIKANYGELVQLPELSMFLDSLEEELTSIKRAVVNKSPLDVNVNDELDALTKQLAEVEYHINQFPKEKSIFQSEVQKFIFLGETKAKLALYEKTWENDFLDDELMAKRKYLEELKELIIDRNARKEVVIKALEETIQYYIDQSEEALDNYKGYKALFDYEKKVLQLRKPKQITPSVIGSSSNHLFMHLCFFLGLHEYFISNRIPYIPSILVLDQPSRPYFDEAQKSNNLKNIDQVKMENIVGSDKIKLTTAFKLLDDFIARMNSDCSSDFQLIVLEHVPEEFWVNAKLKNIHLVEEFRDGNALVPTTN